MSTTGELQTGGQLSIGSPRHGEVFEVLSNERRRLILRALRDGDETMELGALAEQVAAWELGVSQAQVTYDQRKRVYTALQQTHLPMMDEAGAISFDKNRGTVERIEDTDDFDYYLTVVPGGTLLFSHYYLALGIASTILSLFVAADFLAIPVLPETAIPWIIIGLFAVLSGVHVVYRTQSRYAGHEGVAE